MRSVLRGMSVAWIAIIALGLAVPASGALSTFAAGSTTVSVSSNTTVSVNVTATPVVATVLIRSLNISIQVAIQKLSSMNISKNSTAWALVGKANATLQLAVKANATGNYTAAVKYALTGLQYVRQALKQVMKAYEAKVKASKIAMIITRFKAQVAALNRTAYMLMAAVSKAEAKGIINASVAASLKASISVDVKILVNLSRYLSAAENGSVKLNVTYVETSLAKVSRSLATVRKELNTCAAKRIQERIMMMVREKIRKLEKEIARIEAKVREAEAANLTQVAKELEAVVKNLTTKLKQVEESINATVSGRMGGMEKLVAIVNRVPLILIVKEQVSCCSRYVVNVTAVASNLTKIKEAVENVTKAYEGLMSVQNLMPPQMRDMSMDIGHSMWKLMYWYGRLEAAVATGSASRVEEAVKGLLRTAMDVNRTLTEMLAYASGPSVTTTTTSSGMRGGGSGSWGSSSTTVPQSVISRIKEMVKAVNTLIKLVSAEKTVLVKHVSMVGTGMMREAARMLMKVEKRLTKLMRFGWMTGALSKSQVSELRKVEANITKAMKYLMSGNVKAANKTIESSITVLKSIYVQVRGRHGVAVAVKVEIEVMINILVNVQSMISMSMNVSA